MAIYVVMEPPGGSSDDRVEGATMIRDGFSWPAFIVPPLWFLWHRLWIEALLAFVAMGVVAAIGEYSGSALAASLLGLAIPLYAGLEGQALRVAALRRSGWAEWGVVDADRADDAETRYAFEVGGDPLEEPIAPRMVPAPALARPAQTGLALGLSHTPGRL